MSENVWITSECFITTDRKTVEMFNVDIFNVKSGVRSGKCGRDQLSENVWITSGCFMTTDKKTVKMFDVKSGVKSQ